MCDYPFTYTTSIANAAIIVTPSWITFDSSTRMFTVTSITAPADIGVYTITSTAMIISNTTGISTDLTTNYSFTFNVQSDCVNTIITDKTITNMSNKVSLAAVTQDVSFLDSIATSHANPAYCGARTYTFSPTNSFLTITGTTMSLATSIVADVGEYNVDVIVTLTDYPLVASLTK